MANTFEPEGLLVIGFDDKSKSYHDTTFSDSKLSDTSDITDLINRNVDRMFELLSMIG